MAYIFGLIFLDVVFPSSLRYVLLFLNVSCPAGYKVISWSHKLQLVVYQLGESSQERSHPKTPKLWLELTIPELMDSHAPLILKILKDPIQPEFKHLSRNPGFKCHWNEENEEPNSYVPVHFCTSCTFCTCNAWKYAIMEILYFCQCFVREFYILQPYKMLTWFRHICLRNGACISLIAV